MKHFSLAIIASALIAFGMMSTASAAEASTIPAAYNIHVHITKVDSTSGKVTTVDDANLATVDGEAAPLQLLTDTGYIASVTSIVDAKGKKIGGKVVPGHAESGLNMNVTPVSLPDGKVKIDYAVDVSTLESMRSITVSGNTIQLPTVDEQNSHGSAVVGVGAPLTLKSGDKVVTITVNKA